MLRKLLIFATLTVACCQENCPAYSAFSSFPHISSNFQSKLSGNFLVVYTSAPIVNCQQVQYKTDASNITTGRVESPGCCISTDSYTFNSDELDYDIGPIPSYANSCPNVVNEKGSMKLLGTTGTESSLCLIAAVCQPDYYGINVACRGSAPLLLEIAILLFNLLGSIGLSQALALQLVPQTNCVFQSSNGSNCPSF